MTTRNYKLSKQNPKQVTPTKIYENFQESYKENLTHNDVILGPTYGISIYDINYTAVICSSKMSLKVPQTNERENKYANLRMIGLEKNIKQTEEEIKLKGFNLEQLK